MRVRLVRPDAERGSYESQRVHIVARLEVARMRVVIRTAVARSIAVKRRRRGRVAREQTAKVAMHITHIVVVVRVGSTDGELSLLHRSIHTGISISVRHTGVRRNGIALDALAHGHDVEDAAHALCVVLRTGVGYHLYLLYRRCRHTLQHLLRVLRHHVVGSSVDVHLKTRAAVHLDIAIAVYRHHRHLAQHFQYVVGLRVGVFLYVVRNFVDVGFHERLLRHYLHSAQHVRSLLYI